MKKLLKALIILTLSLTLSLSLAIGASAYSETPDGITEEVNDDNLFTKLFDEVKEYATEIFCAMTFIGSLALAYAYKKGLLPLVEKTLVSIGAAVARIKEKTESGELATENLGIAITDKLEAAERTIDELKSRISTMNTALESVITDEARKNDESKNLAIIVSTQIDMLYDIFMTSALPQYQKDAVGERVAKMKEALRGDAEE